VAAKVVVEKDAVVKVVVEEDVAVKAAAAVE